MAEEVGGRVAVTQLLYLSYFGLPDWSVVCVVTKADPGFTNGGGKDEAPQPPREVGCWEGCPLPRGLGRGDADSPEKKIRFWI